MAFIIVGIVIVLGGALVFLLATGRRRATTGRLSRETRARDEGAPVGTAVATTDATEDARARADESKAAAAGVPATRQSAGVVRYEPVDPEELGVTRRQFFNRGILTGLLLAVSGFGAASLAFLWPSSAGGFGGKVNVGSIADVEAAFEKKEPFYNAAAKVYIQPFPEEDLKKAQAVYGDSPAVLAGMEEGFVALYQKCPHLGCRVPWCQTSQWFECPCHGSKYNRVGEKKGGPAPRGMDRFGLEVAGNSILVDTAVVVPGPPIGTDTTGQGQEGAACV
ncbi:MAG: Rieske 2Fe-2S domain-containing protein [Actinobacteria bacterium]|nr:Rieske 2Fe-2S domain-containing protein [Actinomycetota bacterium]